VLLGRAATPTLRRASAMVMPTLRIPARVAAARYFVLACADDLRAVREANETNNCTSSTTRVRVTVPAPDRTAPAAPSKPVTTPAGSGSDSTPLVSGTAEAGSTVRLFAATCGAASAAIASTTATSTGAWQVEAPALASGASAAYAATATDAAGNVSACSVASDPYTYNAGAPGPATQTINSVGTTAWSPGDVTIAAGTKVTWQLGGIHSVISDGPSSFPGTAETSSYSYTFTTAGTYNYHCGIHPAMQGVIRVTA
jgi:plastocyanin